MTIRLSISSFAGTGRTLVAVGTVRLAVMFAAVRAAAPRSRTARSAASAGCVTGTAPGAAVALGLAGCTVPGDAATAVPVVSGSCGGAAVAGIDCPTAPLGAASAVVPAAAVADCPSADVDGAGADVWVRPTVWADAN